LIRNERLSIPFLSAGTSRRVPFGAVVIDPGYVETERRRRSETEVSRWFR
jgi:hypothetical protein